MIDEKEKQEEILKNFVEKEEGSSTDEKINDQIGPKITEIPGVRLPWEKDLPLGNQIGWIPLRVEDLPTRGLFYPKGTKIAIRSATGAEIRHWSTLEDDPNINPNYLYDIDDMVNYIIERCVTIKIESDVEKGTYLSWKDIKEADRFYLLLAIHELTFPEGENKLQFKLSEDKVIDVKKDMVSYLSLDPKIMKYYDEDERCFILRLKSKKVLKLDIPCIGVTQWLKNYVIRKQANQESFDQDFLSFAPFVIKNWRGLNDDIYNKYVEDSYKWDVTTISLLVHFRKIFANAVEPVIKYKDEGGVEHVAPLSFQGGIKSLFIISDPFRELE